MQTFCGKIRTFYEEERVFEILSKKRVLYFYLTRSQLRRFQLFLQEGLFVFFKAFDNPTKRGKFFAYDVINFTKLVKTSHNKSIVYYDISTIKEGVRKLIKKDTYKMFIDLEFTMPPYNYKHTNELGKSHDEKFYSEIIQYGFYLEDGDGNLVDSAFGNIKPKCELGISDRTLDFLKISKEKMLSADSFYKFYKTIKDYMMLYQPTIYVWGKNDFLMIDKSYQLHNLPSITSRKNFVNLMQIMKNYYNLKDDIGLYNAFELLGAKPPLQTQDHNALHDAQATLLIYHLFEKEIS